MKNFMLSPDKHFNTMINVSGDFSYWHSLFSALLSKDVFAPLLIVMGRLNIVLDADCPWATTPYAQRYAWIGEIMSDVEHENVYDAAEKTGLLARGLNDFAWFALSSKERKRTYASAVREIVSTECFARYLTPETVAHCINTIDK